MMPPGYAPRYDAPVQVAYRGDCRAALMAQDRDLLAEARNVDACTDAALEVTCALYPPILLGLTTIPTIQN